MSQLTANNLPENIRAYRYDRDAVTTGILHFGIGNFHRAHQAVYCEDLLEQGATEWGITGVSLRSASMQDALKPQDYLYTLAVLGETTEYRIIGAIKDVLVAPNNPQAVIEHLALPSTQLVSTTITEKGYYLASGKVDFDQSILQAELNSLETPKTIYGFIAAGLIARRATGEKLTIMCCDNISGGGELLKQGVQTLLQKHSPETLEWTQDNVAFVSSMVDRVTPATDDALKEQVLRDTQKRDASPVSAEPFSQWIIEGHFAGKRPAFDKVGATFVDDIAPFEKMKLGYLNAAHTIASTLGYLNGDRFVHEAIEQPDIFKFMRGALYENVLPNAAVPEGYDGTRYIEDVIARFQNGNLPYANLQVGTDSSQKIQQRWFPTIEEAITNKNDWSYFAFSLGAWVNFIKSALEKNVLNDPKKDALSSAQTADIGDMTHTYLKIANADQFNFYNHPDFIDRVIEHAHDIDVNGIQAALKHFLNSEK